jgi:hypothetical protein
MTDLQFLPKPSIISNSSFFYKDTTTNAKEHRIKVSEDKIELRHNIPLHKKPGTAIKDLDPETYSAFDKAVMETKKINDYHKQKYEIVEGKREIIENVVKERNKKLREQLETEKKELEIVLVRIIKDALKFTKENNPIISMMPTKITNTLNQIKEEKKLNSTLNMSTGSINLSFRSNISAGSVKKYESNAFLKALGLDLTNLNPNNIKLDINQAYEFIKKWKVKKEDISKVIRFKVVNEIMNVEERRSVQKIDKMNKRINLYLEKRKEKLKQKRATRQDSVKSVASVKSLHTSNIEKVEKNNLSGSFTNINSSALKIDDTMRTISKTKTQFQPKKIESPKNKKFAATSPNKKVLSPKMQKINSMSKLKNLVGNKHIHLNEDINPYQKPKKIMLNSYNNVDKIVNYLNATQDANEPLIEHFSNIKYNKKMDDLTKNLMNKNKLGIVENSPSPKITKKSRSNFFKKTDKSEK